MEFVFDPSRFWGFALVSLFFIPLQSATEEIILRGYLNQGLSRIIRNPWIVFFITSAGFAALHLGNPEIAQSGLEGNKLITLSGYFFFHYRLKPRVFDHVFNAAQYAKRSLKNLAKLYDITSVARETTNKPIWFQWICKPSCSIAFFQAVLDYSMVNLLSELIKQR